MRDRPQKTPLRLTRERNGREIYSSSENYCDPGGSICSAESVRDFVWHSGDNGKQPVVVGQLSWPWAYVQNWRATPPAAPAAPGTSPTPKPYPSRFPRPISNRSASRIWRMCVSVTISNRRVRTRTHGGVAGVSGQPLPLCRSHGQTGCAVKALVHSGGIPARELVRSTR
jgi:hypothetical protein